MGTDFVEELLVRVLVGTRDRCSEAIKINKGLTMVHLGDHYGKC